MSTEERVTTFEQAFVTLIRLAENMDARMDSTGERANNLEEKMAALADAQIRTEEALTRLARANEKSIARLAEANEGALTRLAEANEESLARLARANEESLTRLAEAQAHTDRRLDALIDIISEGRNGKSYLVYGTGPKG